ncbi:MAG: TlpA family protein disulfide reductase [Candidatus Eremiobacteraeota bacterium]|nr:TlpA family protein disulfide reductase [Candidatus Eremiobacteraeota bacterium]MBV9263103.1 TlpA family protein disulfide reductase [Candidatus Eremiobacteraeota bacterium]
MAKASSVLGVLCTALLAGCAHGSATQGASGTTQPQRAHAGSPAPGWTETSLPGPRLSSDSLRGKAVYLNFFATWCPPCNQEAPAIDALQREYGSRGLQVVGVDVLENAAKAQSFRDGHRLHYPVVVDTGVLRDAYDINGMPVHAFIDRGGILRKVVVGEMSPEAMRGNVEEILR